MTSLRSVRIFDESDNVPEISVYVKYFTLNFPDGLSQ